MTIREFAKLNNFPIKGKLTRIPDEVEYDFNDQPHNCKRYVDEDFNEYRLHLNRCFPVSIRASCMLTAFDKVVSIQSIRLYFHHIRRGQMVVQQAFPFIGDLLLFFSILDGRLAGCCFGAVRGFR